MINKIIKYLLANQIIAGLVFAGLVWLIIEVRYVLIGLFISYIIMAAFYPLVSILRKKGLPNALSVSIIYFAVLACLGLLILPLIPFLSTQIQSLINSFPRYLNVTAGIFGFEIDPEKLKSLLASDFETIGKNAFTFTTRIFGGFFSLLTIIVVSFYLLLDHDKIKIKIIYLFRKDTQSKIASIILRIEEKLGAWLRGQIILSFSVGFCTWVALSLIGLDFALPLALMAGLLEIAPTIGPVISSIPAVIVAFSISPTIALMVVLLYIVIQFSESHILVPRIMQKAVGLHPVIIILGVIIGSHLLGVAGALLAVPFMSFLVVGFQNLKQIKE